jgi:hypothetical protein
MDDLLRSLVRRIKKGTIYVSMGWGVTDNTHVLLSRTACGDPIVATPL